MPLVDITSASQPSRYKSFNSKSFKETNFATNLEKPSKIEVLTFTKSSHTKKMFWMTPQNLFDIKISLPEPLN